MQSQIFDSTGVNIGSYKPQLKYVGGKNDEMGLILNHCDGGRLADVSAKPTVNKIKSSDLMQNKILNDYAKVFNARRNQSAITFI